MGGYPWCSYQPSRYSWLDPVDSFCSLVLLLLVWFCCHPARHMGAVHDLGLCGALACDAGCDCESLFSRQCAAVGRWLDPPCPIFVVNACDAALMTARRVMARKRRRRRPLNRDPASFSDYLVSLKSIHITSRASACSSTSCHMSHNRFAQVQSVPTQSPAFLWGLVHHSLEHGCCEPSGEELKRKSGAD